MRRLISTLLLGALLVPAAATAGSKIDKAPPLAQWSHEECVGAWTQLTLASEMADQRAVLLHKFDTRCMPQSKPECSAYRAAADTPNIPEDLRVVLMRKFERGC